MERKDQILSRMYVVLSLISILPLLVAGQVLRVYLLQGADLRAQGERQANAFVDIPAIRGSILDRAGRTLAVNTARYDIALDPTAPGFSAKAATFFEKLSRLTGQSATGLARKVRQRSSPQYVLLLRGVSEPHKEAIATWDIPGLILRPQFGRRYNYGRTLAHVLGHVDPDLNGLEGLELQYDAYLKGRAGRRAVKRDRRGVIKAFAGGQVVEPEYGQDLVLTVDLVRQTILEEELARGLAESGARWGTAIAMDPQTGAILAMANLPTYDPNRPAAYPLDALRNRAVTDRLEPGSTFKLVMAVAAIEEGIVSMEDSVDTGKGWTVIHGRTLKDTHAYGTITFADVIALSSNVGTAKVVERIEPGVFYQYARNLGFGQLTWVDLPGEVEGVLKKPDQWSGSTLTSMSRGYEVDATPLQILTAYCALANGGLLVQPYIVAERRNLTGGMVWQARQDSIRRVFDRATARRVLPAFERVVETGTAKQAQIEGLRVAGKTGTAMKASGGSYNPGAYRASFVGFFPAEDPAVALLVVLDEPRSSIYGGSVAAPVFQRTAQRWIGTFPAIAARMNGAVAWPEPEERPIPDVVGQPAAVASSRLIAAGFQAERPDEPTAHATVQAQRPDAGEPASPGKRIRLDLAPDTTRTLGGMPNLQGLGARQAAYWLRSQGVEVILEGHGQVVTQSTAAGKALPSRVVLKCE